MIFRLIEPLIQRIFKEIGRDAAIPFRRMPYAEAIGKYGSDKPDLRCGLEIADLSEVFRDADVWIRFAAHPTSGPQVPHDRDEFYIVASGTARYRWEGGEAMLGPGDIMFAAAHTEHGYDRFSDDFSVWVVFYGPRK